MLRPAKIKFRLILTVLLAITAVFGFVTILNESNIPKAYAQQATNPTNTNSYTDNANNYATQGDINKLLIIRDLLREASSQLTCQVRGIEPVDKNTDCAELLNNKNLTQAEYSQKFQQGGLLTLTGNAIGALYTPPASGIDFSKNLASNFGIEKANAQSTGTGFNSLSQIQDIWLIFRNIVYLLLVIIFILLGILIMLRVHIDPRTVMTIQNQIPKAIISIVLITFSYAIAGFLIDAMWVGTYFGINVITENQPSCKVEGQQKTLSSVVTRDILNNPIGFTTNILGDETGCQGTLDGISGLAIKIGSTFGDVVSRIVLGTIGLDEDLGDCSIGFKLPFGAGTIGGDGNVQNCLKIVLFEIIKFFVSIIAFLIVLIAILVALFRLWFSLLKGYIYLIIDILLAPLWILAGLIPGSSLSFTGWAKNVFAQLAVFPAAALLLTIASIIARNPEINDPGGNAFLPPLIGNPNIADNLGALTALGFILLTPNLLEIIREALKTPASKAGAGTSAILGFAGGKVMGSVKGVEERVSHRNEAVPEWDGTAAGKMEYKRKGFFKIGNKRFGA